MLPLFLSYVTLKFCAWLLVGVFLLLFALTDGWDLGVGTLLPFVGQNDEQRRVLLNVVGPTWEGNQVWFIAGGALIFAVWPLAYGVSFSAFYLVLMLALWTLFLRPVGFDYRSKLTNPTWRNAWDWVIFVASFVPALLFGAAFGNLILGVPFVLDDTMRSTFTGHVWDLLHPFALLCGLVSVAMLVTHGAMFLQMRTEGVIQQRAHRVGILAALLFVITFAIAGAWVAFGIQGMQITEIPDLNSAFLPQAKVVETGIGFWLTNYVKYPLIRFLPVIAFLGALLVIIGRQRTWVSFVGSCAMVVFTILTAACSMFPFIVPSSSQPSHSLTIWDSAGTAPSLQMIILFALVFLPIIAIYTFWVYKKLWGTVRTEDMIEAKGDNSNLY